MAIIETYDDSQPFTCNGILWKTIELSLNKCNPPPPDIQFYWTRVSKTPFN